MRLYGTAGTGTIREDPKRCIAAVRETGSAWPRYWQCRRKRGFGLNGLYCKQHAAQIEREESVSEGWTVKL